MKMHHGPYSEDYIILYMVHTRHDTDPYLAVKSVQDVLFLKVIVHGMYWDIYCAEYRLLCFEYIHVCMEYVFIVSSL